MDCRRRCKTHACCHSCQTMGTLCHRHSDAGTETDSHHRADTSHHLLSDIRHIITHRHTDRHTDTQTDRQSQLSHTQWGHCVTGTQTPVRRQTVVTEQIPLITYYQTLDTLSHTDTQTDELWSQQKLGQFDLVYWDYRSSSMAELPAEIRSPQTTCYSTSPITKSV